MKFFQTVQKVLELLGFIRNHGGYRYYPFSIRHFRATVLYLVTIMSIFIYTIHSADSAEAEEYLDSFYIFSVSSTIFISFAHNTFKMTKLFNFLDHCGEMCEKCKSNFVLLSNCFVVNFSWNCCKKWSDLEYPERKEKLHQTNRLAELLSKILLLLVVKIGVPGLILPKVVLSFYKYFGTDARNNAFELPIPAS